ncbi:hypothetical protein QOZ80_2BG0181400 [Eleusine coracana subsp. coracana]|nr:hypothetical protein QOZ80_2BG0181400 [Eleusine coracana subsp. coracana]
MRRMGSYVQTAGAAGKNQIDEAIMSLPSFSMSFATVDDAKRKRPCSRPHPVDHACAATTPPTPARVMQLLDDHRPLKMLNNIAVTIVDQTYAALLEILGPAAAPARSGDDGHVEVSRPVDPADPDSPLLCVNASATHCSIRLVNGGDAAGKDKFHDYLLARASVSVSPGALHVQARGDGPVRGWTCADEVRPNVAEKGLFGVLETIRARLDAAVRVEANLIKMAKASGCSKSPKLNDIIDARMALDVDAFMRRRRQKRRRGIQEISCRPDADLMEDAEMLAKSLGALHVGQKRCQPATVMDVEVDDADVLTKRLRTLQV